MNHGSLFSGMGVFDSNADLMGWNNVFNCEIDSFCRTLLKYHYPNSIHHEDITKTDFSIYRGKIDILTGGFPCQPFSTAGLRKGEDDSRYLWPSMLRVIRDVAPKWIIGENVVGLVTQKQGGAFEQVCADLESEGYKVQPFILPAIAYNANHIRERVWFIAYSMRLGWQDVSNEFESIIESFGDSKGSRQKRKQGIEKTNVLDSSRNNFLQFQQRHSQPAIFNVDDGTPFELHGITIPKWIEQSLKASGNAVYAPLVYELFSIIEHLDKYLK